MKLAQWMLCTCLSAAGIVAAPVQAQDRTLTDSQVDLYAEMLTLSGACSQNFSFSVDPEQVQQWVSMQLERSTSASGQAVQQRTEQKVEAMHAQVTAIQQMTEGTAQTQAMNALALATMSRCEQLSHNRMSGEVFRQN